MRRVVTVLLLSFILAGCLTYTGRVSVKGNEPHSYVVLVTQDDTAYRLVGDLAPRIRKEYQNMTIVVRGCIVKEAVGPGFPAELHVEEIVRVIR